MTDRGSERGERADAQRRAPETSAEREAALRRRVEEGYYLTRRLTLELAKHLRMLVDF